MPLSFMRIRLKLKQGLRNNFEETKKQAPLNQPATTDRQWEVASEPAKDKREIGNLFGLSYSAVSHRVHIARSRINKRDGT